MSSSTLFVPSTTMRSDDVTTVQTTWWLIQLICRLTIDMNGPPSSKSTIDPSSGSYGITSNLQCVHNDSNLETILPPSSLHNRNHHYLYYRCSILNDQQSAGYSPMSALCKSTEPPLPVFTDDRDAFDIDMEFPRNVTLRVFNESSTFRPSADIGQTTSRIVWLTLPNFPNANISTTSGQIVFQNARLECNIRQIEWQTDDATPLSCIFRRTDEYGGDDEDDDSIVVEYDWKFLFVLVFIMAGAIGNLLVCLAICLDRRLQNMTNYFLLSLAIADLLVSLFVMPLGAIQGFFGHWPLGIVWCNVYVTCDVLACSSSIMHMCCISLGRYLGIRNPLKTRHKYATKKLVGIKIAIVWALSVAVSTSVTLLGLHNSRNIMPTPNLCEINNRAFFIFGSLVVFYIPMVIMVVTYTLTVQLLRKKARFLQPITTAANGNNNNTATPEPEMFRRLTGNLQKKPNSNVILTHLSSERIRSVTDDGGDAADNRAKRSVSAPMRNRNSFNRSSFFRRSKCATINSGNPVSRSAAINTSGLLQGAESATSIATIGEISVGSSCPSPSVPKPNKLRHIRLPPLNVATSSLNLRFLATKNKRQTEASAANAVRTEQKASKVLGLVFFTFVFCWAPFFILNILFAICPKPACQVPGHVVDISLWLGYVSSTINPIIYTIFNRRFRTAFIRLLQFRCQEIARPVRYHSVTDSNNRTSSGVLAQTPTGIATVPLSLSLSSTSAITASSASRTTTTTGSNKLATPSSQPESFDLTEISFQST